MKGLGPFFWSNVSYTCYNKIWEQLDQLAWKKICFDYSTPLSQKDSSLNYEIFIVFLELINIYELYKIPYGKKPYLIKFLLKLTFSKRHLQFTKEIVATQ